MTSPILLVLVPLVATLVGAAFGAVLPTFGRLFGYRDYGTRKSRRATKSARPQPIEVTVTIGDDSYTITADSPAQFAELNEIVRARLLASETEMGSVVAAEAETTAEPESGKRG